MPGDGVLITIKWATDFDQWNLFVDDMSTGQTIAQGLNVDSNAQSVLLSRPHNGTYRVRAVPVYTDFDKRDLKYSGSAAVFHDPTQRYPSGVQLLPQIQTVAPANFHIADVPPIPSNPAGWRYTPDGTFDNSCYTDETEQFGSTRCLRFDNDVRNVGTGPLELKFNYSPDAFTGHCDMQQEVLTSDAKLVERNAGPCMFHPQHAHFHYQNFARYFLYPVGADGMPGAQPAAASNKVGFCTIDVDDYSVGAPAAGQRPRTYSFPTCNVPNGYGPGVPEFMGISPGWGDVYTWDLPQQYLDISKGVPDGVYEVVSRANPDGALLTADRNQETGITCVRITGNKVAVLHELPSQSDVAPLPACDGHRPAAAPAKAKAKKAKRHRRRHRAHRRHRRHHHARRHHRRHHRR